MYSKVNQISQFGIRTECGKVSKLVFQTWKKYGK